MNNDVVCAPSEAVLLGRLMEEGERAKIDRSQIGRDGARIKQEYRRGERERGPVKRSISASERVASELGMSATSYKRAKQVIAAAEADPERFGDLPGLMDAPGHNIATANR